jgi:hypothetical protein
VGFDDPLGDRQPKPGAFASVRLPHIGRTAEELVEDVRN